MIDQKIESKEGFKKEINSLQDTRKNTGMECQWASARHQDLQTPIDMQKYMFVSSSTHI